MISPSILETLQEIAHFLTTDWLRPVLALHQYEVREEVEPVTLAAIPEGNIDFFGLESIQDIPLCYFNTRNPLENVTNQVLQSPPLFGGCLCQITRLKQVVNTTRGEFAVFRWT